MSQYVKRCAICRVARGISSYRVDRQAGGRSSCCHWCEDDALYRYQATKRLTARLRPHLTTHAKLMDRLAATRRTIAAIESEILALEPPQQRTA